MTYNKLTTIMDKTKEIGSYDLGLGAFLHTGKSLNEDTDRFDATYDEATLYLTTKEDAQPMPVHTPQDILAILDNL